MAKNPPPKEDSWAFQPIGSPFPDNPVKVFGQQNMYVALWYKHGKPVHGRSWNNGGVVECSFPMGKRELSGAQELGGQIQVLQYKGDHNTLGFWYNWIKYKDRFERTDERQVVRCGDSIPILWQSRPQGPLLGDLHLNTEIARFSHDKVAEELQGTVLSDMYIIVRELKGGPPGCECPKCPKEPPKERIMLNSWNDLKEGDPFPTTLRPIRALNKSLNTLAGENPDQYVALWYQHGESVMGRVWNNGGKVAANFSWGGHEYKTKIGSLQILCELSENVKGFDYDWRPYPEAASFDSNKEWHQVHVESIGKGDICPGVITVDGKQILGKVDVKNEKASYGYQGKENQLVGPAVHSVLVLCRKARPGCKFD